MRILVCGGRDYTDYWKMRQELLKVFNSPDDVLIHGGARGADILSEYVICKICPNDKGGPNIAVERYYADWEKHGKAAGWIRNQDMLEQGKPDLVVAFPGGRGTADMVRRALKAGIEVREVT